MKESLPKKCCTPQQDNEQGGYITTKPGVVNGIERINIGSTEGMILMKGGSYMMGTDGDEGFADDHEGPAREVNLDPFWIDETLVTNEQYLKFMKATGYKTESQLYGWSFVFHNQLSLGQLKIVEQSVMGLQWWLKVDGANWANPTGPGSKIKKILNYPVVHISWNDAKAYAEWAGKRLATEAEWEFASRGGHEGRIFPWGNELEPEGKHMSNVFQGTFPQKDTSEDGFAGPSPVKSYPANDYGLYDMIGNVWEWVNDWWVPEYRHSEQTDNPFGPPTADAKIMKGGSFLCHDSYCNRYRCAARTANTPESATINCGFRCVRDVD